MEFSKRLESLELAVKDVRRLLQQKSASPRTGSRPRVLREDPIISLLDGLSKSVIELKKDLEHVELLRHTRRAAHETADNETALGAGHVSSDLSPLPRQYAETGRGSGGANDRSSAGSDDVVDPGALAIADMGYTLADNLGRYGTDFSGKIHVPDLNSFNLAEISKRLTDPDPTACLTLKHSSTSHEGISKLGLAKKATFRFPDFSDLPRIAPQGYNKAFEAIIASTPSEPLTYYVGPPLTPDFNTLLSPGKLVELGEIPGVTTHYWHTGEKNSGTAFHYEDGAVRSCNITIAGFKLWILIDVSSNAKFEDFVQSLYPSAQPQCGQWLRHLNILISPATLLEKDIRFRLILAGPGDMVVTKRRQYHAVLNLTACFAISINFALSTDPVLEITTVCPCCGLYKFEHPAVERLANPNVARKGLQTKRRANGSVKKALRRPEYKPDELEPNESEPDANGDGGQADEIIVGNRSQRDTEEDNNDEGGSEQTSQPGASTPTSSNDNVSTGQSSHIRHSSNVEFVTDVQLGLPSDMGTSPDSSFPCEEQPSAHCTEANSSLTHAEFTTRVVTDEHVSKRNRLCLPDAQAPSDELLRADPHCNIPKFDRITPPDARILRLATAVRSRYAIRQFCDLVNSKRNRQLQNVLFPSYDKAHAAQHLIILNGLKNGKPLTHINQYLFATKIQEARIGGLRVSSSIKQEMIQASGMDAKQYESHLSRGKDWRKVCGGFEGLLSFILSDKHNPFQVSPAMYRDMKGYELEVFHSLLADDYTNTICTAGKAFEQSLGGQDCYFAWEGNKLSSPLYELPEDKMLLYIQPVPLLLEDQHYAAEFPDWPDPTRIPLPEKQCDYCSSQSCTCYFSKATNSKPRIMAYPGKGLGLQAISPEPGVVAYQRNELIGFLTGKLVPQGTLDNDRVAEFHHCQIDCRDEGNEFRLMNHACPKHAVARLAERRVSGRFRQSVLALKKHPRWRRDHDCVLRRPPIPMRRV